MSNYYCLVTELPKLTLDDKKLAYTVADYKSYIYPQLTAADKKLADLFFLQYDNRNVLRLLADKNAETDPLGNYTAAELNEYIDRVKADDPVPAREFPTYLATFISEEAHQAGTRDVLPEDRLAGLYYDYASKAKNRFVSRWFAYNLKLNNLMVALTANKYGLDTQARVVGTGEVAEALKTSRARDFGLMEDDVDKLDEIFKIFETGNILEREHKLDRLRWDWMEEQTVADYFGVERLYVFLLQTDILERWLTMDKKMGGEKLRKIIQDLRDEVRKPGDKTK